MKTLDEYLKLLTDNDFTYIECKNKLIKVFKYGESLTLMWSDFNDNLLEYCEDMLTFKNLDYIEIELYAYSLLHYKIKPDYKSAYKESLRYHKKFYQGFVEPQPCQYISKELLKLYQRENKLKRILK